MFIYRQKGKTTAKMDSFWSCVLFNSNNITIQTFKIKTEPKRCCQKVQPCLPFIQNTHVNFKWLYMHDGFIISSAIGNQLEKMKTHHLAWASAGDSLTSLLATSDFRYSAPLAPVSGPWSQLAWVITARHFLFFPPLPTKEAPAL